MQIMEALKEKLAAMAVTPEVAAALLADRCRQEPQLADRLRDNPRICLEKLSNRELPKTFKIVLHDNSDDTWHLPLPRYSQDQDQRLSEEQLEKIAAGEAFVTTGGIVLVGFLALIVGVAGIGVGVGHATGKS